MCSMFPPPSKTNQHICEKHHLVNPHPPSHTPWSCMRHTSILKALTSPTNLSPSENTSEVKFVLVAAARKMFPALFPAPSASLQHCPRKVFTEPPSVSCLEFVSFILTVFGYRHPIPDLVHALIPSLFICDVLACPCRNSPAHRDSGSLLCREIIFSPSLPLLYPTTPLLLFHLLSRRKKEFFVQCPGGARYPLWPYPHHLVSSNFMLWAKRERKTLDQK